MKQVKIYVVFVLTVSIILFSCNSEFPNILQKEYSEQKVNFSKSKVLVILIDGIRGAALEKFDPDNLRFLARKSLYSFYAIGDINTGEFTRERGLANIMTGVTADKHGVTGNDLSTINNKDFPTFVNYLKQSYPKFHSTAMTSDAAVSHSLFNGADKNQVLVDDEAVVNSTVDELALGQSSLVISHLVNPKTIGHEHSFESNDLAYHSAVLTVDRQIQKMIDAIGRRSEIASEDWLVVITSSVGGKIKETGNTFFDDGERNTFSFLYSPKFTRKYYTKPIMNELPFVGNAPQFNFKTLQEKTTSARLLDASKLNFGTNQDVTIHFFFKDNGPASPRDRHSWPVIMSKKANLESGSGWCFFINNEHKMYFKYGGSSPGEASSGILEASKWYAITVSINRATSKMSMYINGKLTQEATIPAGQNVDNKEPFTIGRANNIKGSYDDGNFSLCNVQIYNRAFAPEEVRSMFGYVKLTEDKVGSAIYNSLIAYWPAYGDVATRTIRDVTKKTGELIIPEAFSVDWVSINEFVSYFKPELDDKVYRTFPSQVDLSFFIFQWLGVLPKTEWNLDGKAFNVPYELLTY